MRSVLVALLLACAPAVVGQTWIPIAGELTEPILPFPSALARTPDRAYVAAIPYVGVFRAEADFNWVRVTAGRQNDGAVTNFAHRGTELFAASHHLLHSTDDGRSWEEIPTPHRPITNVAVLPGGEIVIYAGGVVYLSADSCVTWQQRSTREGWEMGSLADGTLFVVGAGLWRSSDAGSTWMQVGSSGFEMPVDGTGGAAFTIRGTRVFRSLDSGATWTDVAARPAGLLHTLRAASWGRLFVGLADGLHGSENGIDWVQHYGPVTAGHGPRLLVPPGGGDVTALIATGEPSIRRSSFPDHVSWAHVNEGFEREPSFVAMSEGDAYLYFTDRDRLFRTTDAGGSWERVLTSFPPVNDLIALSDSSVLIGTSNGLQRLAQRPSGTWGLTTIALGVDGAIWTLVRTTRGTLFAGMPYTGPPYPAAPGRLFHSQDDGATWTEASIGAIGLVRDIAATPGGLLVAAVNSAGFGGGIYRSEDNGVSWTRVGPLFSADAVAVSSSGRVLAVGASGLYESDDGGLTWEPIAGAPQFDRVATAPDGRFLGYYLCAGVYTSLDGSSWVPLTAGLGTDCVSLLSTDRAGHVYAHGVAGTYRTLGPLTDGEPDAPDVVAELRPIRPTHTSSTAFVEYRVETATSIYLELFDVLGRPVSTLARGLHLPGSYTATLDARGLSSGRYLVRLVGGSSVQTEAVVVSR